MWGENFKIAVQFIEKQPMIRVRPRFFDQVGHQTTNSFSLNNIIVRHTKIMNRADKNWANF